MQNGTASRVQSLAVKYHSAKAAGSTEYAEAKRVGALATDAGRQNPGQHAFGGSRRQALRSKKFLMKHWIALAKQRNKRDSGEAMLWVQQGLASGATVAESLSLARDFTSRGCE